MTAVFLQVRLDSKRLPGKALLKIGKYSIIEHSMRALLRINADKNFLLTTSDSLGELKPLAEKWGFEIFSGPKNDVLKRFVLAAQKYNIQTVIRATGDNPLVSGEIGRKVLAEHLSSSADYSNWTDAPLGSGVEIVETSALLKADLNTDKVYDREHVTPWIYNNPDRFILNIKKVPPEYLMEYKISVDTEEDLERIKDIFNKLYNGQPIELDKVIEFLKQE